jgi:hypothetical protein
MFWGSATRLVTSASDSYLIHGACSDSRVEKRRELRAMADHSSEPAVVAVAAAIGVDGDETTPTASGVGVVGIPQSNSATDLAVSASLDGGRAHDGPTLAPTAAASGGSASVTGVGGPHSAAAVDGTDGNDGSSSSAAPPLSKNALKRLKRDQKWDSEVRADHSRLSSPLQIETLLRSSPPCNHRAWSIAVSIVGASAFTTTTLQLNHAVVLSSRVVWCGVVWWNFTASMHARNGISVYISASAEPVDHTHISLSAQQIGERRDKRKAKRERDKEIKRAKKEAGEPIEPKYRPGRGGGRNGVQEKSAQRVAIDLGFDEYHQVGARTLATCLPPGATPSLSSTTDHITWYLHSVLPRHAPSSFHTGMHLGVLTSVPTKPRRIKTLRN